MTVRCGKGKEEGGGVASGAAPAAASAWNGTRVLVGNLSWLGLGHPRVLRVWRNLNYVPRGKKNYAGGKENYAGGT